MRLLRIALAWLLLCGPVLAQAQLGAGQVWGNSTAARASGKSETVTAILDRALGATRGSVIERGASGWGLIGPGTAGLPFVSAGAGADPLYQVVGVIGGGTGINLYAIGDILCATGTTTLSRTADIATGNVLLSGGVGACPTYGKVTSAQITGAALTKTDDTNVTLTLGGTPASALVNAASLTLGWTGTLSVARGGTGAGTQQAGFEGLAPTPTRAGDVIYWNGTHYVTLAGNNSGTNVLTENASGVPSWAASGTGTVTSAQLSAGQGINIAVTAGANPCITTCNLTISMAASTLTNSLSADVTLNNTATYFTGPTVAQGTSGIWLATGTVTVADTGGAAAFDCRLTDGTTNIAASRTITNAVGNAGTISLSGVISSPAGNIIIQCKDSTAITGFIRANTTSNGNKDSTLTVYRIQ